MTTPHLLTEVNSLANALPENIREQWHQHFQDQTSTFLEVLEFSGTIMQESSFLPYGLADASIENIAKDTLVLTEDYRFLASWYRWESQFSTSPT